tara:strand:- start:22039 stop:22839 length:801 start_codon:yes stop_codon:yes gene_type:complete
MKAKTIKNCPICNFQKFRIKFSYSKKPYIETDFEIKNYSRSYFECINCKHWISNFIISEEFYKNFYSKKTYGENYKQNFSKIINLKKKSDNYLRSNRIEKFLKKNKFKKIKILDVGSGLGVFPYEMNRRGYEITAMDPDERMSNFIKTKLGIETINSDFKKLNIRKKYNLITFNKVLEHVENPLSFLKKAKKFLSKENNGIYIEVPDTNEAKKISKNREEFAIEHINCFTKKSLIVMLQRSHYKLLEFKKIKEPSGKLTMYIFAKL